METDWLISGSSYVHEILLNKATLASFTRNDLYQEKSRTLMNSMQQRSEYDRAGRLQTQVLLEGNFHERVRLKREYHYDKIGQLVGVSDSTRGDALYRYDPLGRIVRAATPVFDETFSFDPASNITTAIAIGTQTTTLPADVPAVVGNVLREYAGTHFEYDAQGNMVGKSSPGCRQEFSWNAFHQLVSVRTARDGASDVVATYYYDAFGRRIGKQVGKGDGDAAPVRVIYGWDGENLAFESIVGHERTKHYLYEYESFVPLAQYLSPASANAWTDTAAGTVRDIAFFHCDRIGTPRNCSMNRSAKSGQATISSGGSGEIRMHPIPQMRLTMRTTTSAFKGSTTIVNPVCITTVIGTMIPIPDDISVRSDRLVRGHQSLSLRTQQHHVD